jgi:hypothetical protein
MIMVSLKTEGLSESFQWHTKKNGEIFVVGKRIKRRKRLGNYM